ncbi:PEP-CTERM sorting domain-containing protein [uncultured Nostoc sp.]|uniref:PEP-CTERM sorting domain-containing protein n=1 Tax=uncultured Nostoc sp. TaxID=340711 RepID=UPI0035CA8363
MINFKSRLLNATLAVTAAIPLATAGLFTSAGSAQAYTGGFTFDGNGTVANITNTGTTFAPNPGSIALGVKQGDFLGDTNGTIYSFLNASLPSKFIDVGPQDNIKLLSLTNLLTPAFTSIFGGTQISFNFTGVFEDGTNAIGNIDFTTLTSLADATSAYSGGGTISASFKGLSVTAVPEPTVLLGLGAVGAVMAMSRRRKSFVQ